MTTRLRAMRVLMNLPAVLFGLVVLLGAMAVMPAGWQVWAFVAAVAAFTVVTLRRVEPWLVRIWLGARRPHAREETTVAALVRRCQDGGDLGGYDVMLAPRLPGGATAITMGRRSLVLDARLIDSVDSGRVPPTFLEAAVLRAIGVHRCRSHRADVVVATLAAPWRGLSCVCTSLACAMRCGGLVRHAWRLRVAVAAVAVARTVQAGDGLVAATVVVLATLTYATPAARRAVESYEAEMADDFLRHQLTLVAPVAGPTSDRSADRSAASIAAGSRPVRLTIVR